MKKSLFPRLALMAVVVALVSACSQKKQEYTDVIPANAHTVVSINLKSLADKAGLNDKENKEVQEKLTNALKSGMNAATFQQVEMIMKDPKKSGIDVSEPLYIFTTETFPTTIIAKVSSEDDLHALLETLEKEKVCQPLSLAIKKINLQKFWRMEKVNLSESLFRIFICIIILKC